jgi:hypothetical protein
MRACVQLAVFVLCAPTVCSAQGADARVASDDSAIYVALVAPSAGRERGRAVAEPIDLRRAEGAHSIGIALALRAPGFDTALVAGIALRARPTLLWREPDDASTKQRVPPNFADGSMERVELDPRRIPLSYSVVQYSGDRKWAVVFEVMYCGPLCGVDRYVALHRDAVGGWRVAAEAITVVS